MNNILGFVIPTIEPDTAFNYLLKESSLESIKCLRGLATFLFNFQGPWTNELIEKAVFRVKKYGFDVKYQYHQYDIPKRGHIPIMKIRDDAARLLECKYYALLDDDMEFKGPSPKMDKSAGEQYLDSLHYLETHPNCGIVIMGGTLVRKIKTGFISPTCLNDFYATGKGFILRAIDKRFTPEETRSIIGGGEEQILAGYRLVNGYYPAKLRASRTRHYENHKKVIPGREMFGWIDVELLNNNAGAYIKSHFNPNFKGYSENCSSYDIVDESTYISNGGSQITQEFIDQESYDYNNINVSDEIELLKRLNKVTY